jgi:hypothetical protein
MDVPSSEQKQLSPGEGRSAEIRKQGQVSKAANRTDYIIASLNNDGCNVAAVHPHVSLRAGQSEVCTSHLVNFLFLEELTVPHEPLVEAVLSEFCESISELLHR